MAILETNQPAEITQAYDQANDIHRISYGWRIDGDVSGGDITWYPKLDSTIYKVMDSKKFYYLNFLSFYTNDTNCTKFSLLIDNEIFSGLLFDLPFSYPITFYGDYKLYTPSIFLGKPYLDTVNGMSFVFDVNTNGKYYINSISMLGFSKDFLENPNFVTLI